MRRFLNIQALAGREFLESAISSDMPEDEEGLRSFVVVSLPLEGELVSTSDVRGRYVSVDYVRELQDGEVEIFMALCVCGILSLPSFPLRLLLCLLLLLKPSALLRAMPEGRFRDGCRI